MRKLHDRGVRRRADRRRGPAGIRRRPRRRAARSAQRQGAFAGARLRVPLDGSRAGKAQAGLTVAPMLQGRQADGSIRTRFGEGVELRLTGERGPQMAFGGRTLAQLTDGRTGPDGRKLGVSTIGWVAIGVGVAAIARRRRRSGLPGNQLHQFRLRRGIEAARPIAAQPGGEEI